MINEDTICAIATGQGGAIGIIRISGPEAITITNKIFCPADKGSKPLTERKAYSIAYGQIKNENDEILDDVLVSLFRAPHSYTGEDCTEISCHGSAYILQQIMQVLVNNGCRTAEPGEYTRRAFLNGKMDLSQAEAVADLIASSSSATHKLAMNQMRGAFSHELSELRDKLLRLTSLMELELDFSDHEELEFADRTQLNDIAQQIENVVSQLVSSFSLGNAIKRGVPVAIIGETNAGKSTLLNDVVNIDGIMFRFIDTAGIRETSDTIERLGIDRTFKKIEQANIVIWVVDPTDQTGKTELLSNQIFPLCKEKQLIIAFNKTDITGGASLPDFNNQPINTYSISISAKHGTNIDKLKNMLTNAAGIPAIASGNVIVTNTRHYEALKRTLTTIRRVRASLTTNLPADLISQDLRECIHNIAEIVGGEITSEETLQNIFKNFCIGK